jgi:hypothetical protein
MVDLDLTKGDVAVQKKVGPARANLEAGAISHQFFFEDQSIIWR